MRLIWAPVGLMILCWIFIPESPWYHARRGNKDKAIKTMKQLYGGIKGYDFEEEYGIIARTIEHEREVLQEKPKYVDVVRGLNLVGISFCSAVESGEGIYTELALETYPHHRAPRRRPAVRWSRYHQRLLNLCVPYPPFC